MITWYEEVIPGIDRVWTCDYQGRRFQIDVITAWDRRNPDQKAGWTVVLIERSATKGIEIHYSEMVGTSDRIPVATEYIKANFEDILMEVLL